MPTEPAIKRVVAFVDGQNLYRSAKTACAYPVSPVVPRPRGINGTDRIRIDRVAYDVSLDTRDYRPKPKT